jgi:hypothetical protein
VSEEQEQRQEGVHPAEQPEPLDVFDAMWDALAKDGFCDERGGREYQRVRDAWFRHGYFNNLHGFIIKTANEGPSENSAS